MAGQLFATNSIGGFYASFNLSKDLRDGVKATSKFRQFADIKDAWGKVSRTGQTFTWDTIPMMTRASRALQETNAIPQGSQTINNNGHNLSGTGYELDGTDDQDPLLGSIVLNPPLDCDF